MLELEEEYHTVVAGIDKEKREEFKQMVQDLTLSNKVKFSGVDQVTISHDSL